MVKETQKAKIERLEKENKLLNAEIEERDKIIRKLNNEIICFQEKYDKGGENSPIYMQMNNRIKVLELKNKSLEDTIQHNNKVHELINEKKHNERGAGRKSRFSEEEKSSIKMYRFQGKTIKEIAEMFKCSTGLVHKIINEK